MATLSFRDRFFSPRVARALTSPSAILATGAGAAIGVVATVGTGGLIVPVAGLIGGLVGYGARVLAAVPRNASGPNIDPFGVNEPWRHAVQDALSARRRFTEAIKTFEHGPLRDTLHAITSRLDDAVEEVWNVAKQGQLVANARKRIVDREIQWELQQAAAQIPAGGEASPTQAKTIASLKSQLESGRRMDDLMRSTFEELGLLNARLDETVTQAIELSVTNRTGSFGPVGADVEDIVDSLTSLRQAMTSMDASAPPTFGSTEPGEPPGQVQSSPGT